jgi:hypothetical protein
MSLMSVLVIRHDLDKRRKSRSEQLGKKGRDFGIAFAGNSR